MSAAARGKKRKIIIWSIIGILAAALVVLWLVRPRNAGAYEQETVKTMDLSTKYSFSGAVETKNRETVTSAKVMQVSEILVGEGAKVKKDDVVMKTSQGEEIKAAIAGEVSKVYVEQNQQVMAGVKMMDIVDYDNLQVTIKVDEYDISAVEEGKEVTVTLNALDQKVSGVVSGISREAVNTNGVSYFTVTIDLGMDENVRVGMSVEVEMVRQSVNGATVLSMNAIQFDSEDQPYVLVQGDKRLPERVNVKTGINDGTNVQITEGVKAGDVVLIPKSGTVTGFGMRRATGSTNSKAQ